MTEVPYVDIRRLRREMTDIRHEGTGHRMCSGKSAGSIGLAWLTCIKRVWLVCNVVSRKESCRE
jgi:hypothetical protein